VILAVDGGNSKTDLALVEDDGTLIAHVRGPLSSPHHLGLNGCVDVLQELVDRAGLDGRRADVGQVLLAGVDFPEEEQRLHDALQPRGWAAELRVGNDTFAVLRAGTERGWGIAITCGAGINCLGVGPDGKHVRFPSLGEISGDWGGGSDVGMAGLWTAARSEDGRGPKTELEQLVPEYFGYDTPAAVAYALHVGELSQRRLNELAPIVLKSEDPVALEIGDRLADEVVAMARATFTRLGLDSEPVEVLLGGGLMRNADARLFGRIESGMREVSPAIVLRRTSQPPIVGAALLGLDAIGAGDDAQARVRTELGAAVAKLEFKEDV
jgi:N-acetylglucosamine kinase-like BadF-type ATPase